MNMPELKDRGILLGWIGGLVFAALALWSFTQGLQAEYLLRVVNKTLSTGDDPRRLAAPLAPRAISIKPFGIWYSLAGSDKRVFVFAILWEGIFVPAGAFVSPEGRVLELLPLGVHSNQVLKRLPQGIIGMYVHRIETAAAERGGA